MPLYLGLDSSTQSLTAVVIEVEEDRRHVVFETSLVFDETLPQYGTKHGVLPRTDASVATSSPLMWAEALDVMMRRLSKAGLEMGRLAAISGSAQQHGSVYLNASAAHILETLDPARPLHEQIAPGLSRAVAPIWMDMSTRAECDEITAAAGGETALSKHTGSRAFERFTGPQIRKFAKQDPTGYAATERIHLVSSFLASLLIGRHAPLDPGDASGMNLMDLRSRGWWSRAVDATAPALLDKLPRVVRAWTIAGELSPYWQERYKLPPAQVITWSGDNPSSLIGTGLISQERIVISLGTSDTLFGLMKKPRTDPTCTGHVFGAPTGAYMGLVCFSNGSLARERVRDTYGLTWEGFSHALDRTPPGNGGRILIPWFEPEITPSVPAPGAHRYDLPVNDEGANVRAIVEAQQMAMAIHSRWMAIDVDTIYATGGGSANRQILQVMADVFGADVYRLEVSNSAALGAALRAMHGHRSARGQSAGWDDIIAAFAEPVAASRTRPNASGYEVYRGLLSVYAACEAHALGGPIDPMPLIEEFRKRRPSRPQ